MDDLERSIDDNPSNSGKNRSIMGALRAGAAGMARGLSSGHARPWSAVDCCAAFCAFAVICAQALFGSLGAQAARISVASGQGGAPLITIRGELDLSDAIEFMRKTSSVRDAVVVLRSPGGSLLAGLQIGRTSRQRGFLTLIPANSRCSSACALAWLGGTPRFMARNSFVGFHGAYFLNSGRARASATANAAIDDYLRQLKLSKRAIKYMTVSPPEKLAWLTVATARDLGIEIGIYGRGEVSSTLGSTAKAFPSPKRAASPDLPGNELPGMPISASTASRCECWPEGSMGSAEPDELASGVK